MQNRHKSSRRRQLRLKKYDYSQPGFYFVTICVYEKRYLFGEIMNQKMQLNLLGKIIEHYWKQLPEKFNQVELDEYIIMPNHLHGIISLEYGLEDQTLGEIIGVFKSITACEYFKGIKNNLWLAKGRHFWQRNYYEHVVRNEKSLFAIREYIANNPLNWHLDQMNLERKFQNVQWV